MVDLHETLRPIDVTLHDTVTGLEAVQRDAGSFDANGFFHSYLWEEGNFGCDCNRFHLWADWGRRYPETERACGMTRFIITSIVDVETGKTVYSEPRGVL